MSSFLEVKDLSVRFPVESGVVHAVNGLSFNLESGKSLGIVGESGSGKSVTSLAIMGLLKESSAQISGSIFLDGQELVTASERDMQKIRSTKISMIFQDSLAALNPYFRIGKQIAEVYQSHNKVSKADAKKRAIEMLDRVGIPNAAKRFSDYPHQFSGGMRQRAMIAMALVCNPKLLIADEPTTALDVTVQSQILELLKDIQKEFSTSIIFITHDIGVISEFADDVLVMYAGRAVEKGSVVSVLTKPQHPYSWSLLSSIPDLNSHVTKFHSISGMPPSMLELSKGCAFEPRCDFKSHVAGGRCAIELPDLNSLAESQTQQSRCFLSNSDREKLLVPRQFLDK
jgi:peptide/nickel transport system ATP-binding protein